ncbi:long-chain fatty acid transporter [Pedobacter sp. HMF7647]|uniref:Long-chain fatty acid transporter n=1 Tax=Hufsiella arboris TaxID=2695275 RepID=A0A7K1YES4_9SPHI|nr:outer membrane protein transport protein [Hufsiella arboris]MXV53106.1 long-chain fatty acid transporter [Hufsiella arboris]
MRKILLGILMSLPVLVFGQGFQVNLQGQKQTAMGGAGTGLAIDEASLFFNPGAVSMLEKNGVQVGANLVFLKSAFLQTGSSTVEYNKSEVAPPFQGYAVFGSDKIKFGIAAYTPFGGLMKWDDNWSGKYSVTSLNLKAIYVQPTVSVKLTDYLGLGGGLVYTYGDVNLQRGVPLSNSAGESGKATLDGHGNGWGWNAGIYLKAITGVTIGISHRSKVDVKVKDGDAVFELPASLGPYPTSFSSQLALPATTTLGFGIYPSKKTTIAFDANWVQWHVYRNLAFAYSPTGTRIPNTNSPRNYKDAAALRLGIQNQTTSSLTLRAGIGYAWSPVVDGYVTPEVPDADRLMLSAGLGYNVTPKFSVDASFLFEGLKDRTQTNIETGLSGKFASDVYVPGISLSYKW